MNCFEVKRNIHLYLDGEFGDREACEVEEHLKVCNRCRSEYEYYIALRSVLKRAFRKKTAPIYLRANIRNMLKREERRARNKKFSFLFGGAMAVAAALMLLLWPISNSPDEFRGGTELSGESYPDYFQNSVKFSVGGELYPTKVSERGYSPYSNRLIKGTALSNFSFPKDSRRAKNRGSFAFSSLIDSSNCEIPSYSPFTDEPGVYLSKPLCSPNKEKNLRISGNLSHFNSSPSDSWRPTLPSRSQTPPSFP